MNKVIPLPLKGSAVKRFWKHTGKAQGCWPWLAYRDQRGYGTMTVDYICYKAHRISWVINKGRDPGDLLVCHRCDNPSCVNPKHLFIGTNSDNMLDCSRKGRMSYERNTAAILAHNIQARGKPRKCLRSGENVQAKLTPEDAAVIWNSFVFGVPRKDISAFYKVSGFTIDSILHGRTYHYATGRPYSPRKQRINS